MKSSRETPRTRALLHTAAIGIVLAAGLAAYSNSFSGPFVLDDLDEITHNDHIRLKQLSPSSLWDAAWRSPSQRRPVANVTLALNYFADGYDVLGYHLVNLAIHLACSILVYLFAYVTFDRVTGGERFSSNLPAMVAALVFVCHPVQIQAVTYVVQRMTSLAVLFYLAAVLFYIRGRTSESAKRRWGAWCGGLACGLLAMGTKEIAVTLPLAILIYEWYFFQNLDARWARRTFAIVLPTITLIAAVVLAIPAIRQELFGGYQYRDFNLVQRLLTECRVLVYYLSLVVWPLPARLSITHDFAPSQGLFQPVTTSLSLVTLIALAAVAVVTAKKLRIVSFGIVWFFLQLAVESTVLPLELAFEHRLYLPMVGLSLLIAWVLCAGFREVRWIVSATVVLVLALAIATHERNRVWRDDYLLWTDVLAKYPGDARAHNNLGIARDAKGQTAAAADAYRRAVELRPEYADALNNLGGSLIAAGSPEEAVPHFRKALELDPDHADARYNLGVALSKLGDNGAAIAAFRRALEIRPGFVEAHNNLGYALDTDGKLDEAINHYRLALAIDPRSAEVLNNLGVALAKQGKLPEAVETLQQSIAISPDDADTHYNLGNLFAAQGQTLDAQIHLRRALELALAKGDQAMADAIRGRLQP